MKQAGVHSIRAPTVILLVAGISLLSGCQAIFTFSPLTSLQRKPENLPMEQRIAYARNALAAGSPQAMRAAYDSLKDVLMVEAQYVSAQLAQELSGVPRIILGLTGLSGNQLYLTRGRMNEIGTYLLEFSTEPALLIEASSLFRRSLSLGQALQPMDYLFGSFGLLLEAAQKPDGAFDFSNTSDPTFVSRLPDAISFLDLGIAALGSRPADDPMRVFLSTFYSYLQSL